MWSSAFFPTTNEVTERAMFRQGMCNRVCFLSLSPQSSSLYRDASALLIDKKKNKGSTLLLLCEAVSLPLSSLPK